mgnify:CR=1 FL=1
MISVTGDPENGSSRGLNCVKGYYLAGALYGEDRLTTPLIRDDKSTKGTPDGLREATWDEALDLVAQGLTRAKEQYGNRSILPELRVIDSGLLRGFVTINPRWAGFKPADYYQASASIHPPDEQQADASLPSSITLVPGDFDMRGFEIARSEFFDNYHRPMYCFKIRESSSAPHVFGLLGKTTMWSCWSTLWR